MAGPIRRWEAEILAFHTTGGASNRPTEAVNLLIKNVLRMGRGFRNFDNYRLRLLLHCGVEVARSPAARIRKRQPRLVSASIPIGGEYVDRKPTTVVIIV